MKGKDVRKPETADDASIAVGRDSAVAETSPLDRLLDCATNLAVEFGPRGFTPTRICQEAKVSRTTYYRYFPNNGDIFEAIVSRGVDRYEEGIANAIDGWVSIDQLIMRYVGYISNVAIKFPFNKLIQANPLFMVQFHEKYMPRGIDHAVEVLSPAFDAADGLSGGKIDRRIAAHAFVRLWTSILFSANPPLADNNADALEWALRALLRAGPRNETT